MTRAQELRRLLLEVKAGEWSNRPAEALSERIIAILARRTGNRELCGAILIQGAVHSARYARKEFENGTHEG